MNFTVINSPNYGYPRTFNGSREGRYGFRVKAIVNHIAGGSDFDSTMRYLMTEGSPASYHLLVRRSGEIIQLVHPDNCSWSNGGGQDAIWPLHDKSLPNANLETFNICMERHNHQAPTEEQYQSVLRVHDWALERFKLSIIPKMTIIGHSDIAPIGRWYCPGSGMPWDRLFRDLRAIDDLNEYTVQRGDTLYRIARKHGTTIERIVADNDIPNPDRIYPGQVLVINGKDVLPDETPAPYTVKRGDALSRIALRFGYTTRELARFNNISNPDLIHPGQVIKFPPK